MESIDVDLGESEITVLTDALDRERAAFLDKIAGLDQRQLGHQLPTSSLTLAGLTKHLALVEDDWFQNRFLGLGDPEPWASAPFGDDPDWDFHSAIHDDPDMLRGLYGDACERSRQAFASAQSLDDKSALTHSRTGERFSLRWIMLHLIEETARHTGHADLLRESLDASAGRSTTRPIQPV